MEPIEIRNLDTARRFVVEGFHLQRAVKPSAATVRTALEWAMEVASGDQPLPPVGFVADVGHVLLDTDAEQQRTKECPFIPEWSKKIAERYDDYVLGKLYADWTFERASDALRRYKGRDQKKDQVKGIAYIVSRIRDRAGCGGVFLPPAVIRGLLQMNPEEVLALGWERLATEGPMPELRQLYDELVSASRRMAELLGNEDVLALEQRTALADMGQYVAHRQLLMAAARLESWLPARPPRPHVGRKEVPTRVLDEDQYPVGGYSAISTKGSIESLLHSQLAYIEPPPAEGPDLFDMKYARDELYYYSRDENQFLRRRRAFVFVLFPDLLAARFKDAELPYQRIVMVLSAILALVRKLSDWLSADAIRFDVLFVQQGDKKPLGEEAALMELFFREASDRGDAAVKHVPDQAAVVDHLNHQARQSQVHCLAVAAAPLEMELEHVVVTEVVADGPRPSIGGGDGVVTELEGDEAFEVWEQTILRVLQLWM
jgi:hypothetical protein